MLQDHRALPAVLASFRPDLVGIFGLSSSHREVLDSARMTREGAAGARVFVGGPGPTLGPDDFDVPPADAWIDHVFLGEAEITFTRLADGFAKGGGWPTERRIHGEAVTDLNALPFVDRDGYAGGEAKHSLLAGRPGPMYSMLNSRWCRKKCRFCAPAASLLFGGVKKLRSVDHFLAEMQTLPPHAVFMVHDDNMIENEEWSAEFAERYRPFARPFICQAYPAEIVRSRDLLKTLKDVGLVGVLVGFESGSDRMLRLMRKGTTRAINEQAAAVLHELGIGIQANVMFGCPSETGEEMMQTVEMFNRYIWPAIASPAVYTPYPGSAWYEELKQQGLIRITDPHQYERGSHTQDKIAGVDYGQVRQAIRRLRGYAPLWKRAARPAYHVARAVLARVRS
jgi:radical SAM superfamily enzyme YgiQ (UPF0313 family)